MEFVTLYRLIMPIIGITSIIMMVVLHFGYRRMYLSIKNRFLLTLQREEYYKNELRKYEENNKYIGIEVKNEKINIVRTAINNREAIRQIDAIDKFYREKYRNMFDKKRV